MASNALADARLNVGIAVARYATNEGTGGYVANLLPGIAQHHEVTLYTAEVGAPVPDGVSVVLVPTAKWRTYSAILSFPLAFQAVRRRHDIVHAQGWVTSSAEVVTVHIVLAAWRRAARAAGVRPPLGERLLGAFVERREAALIGRVARQVIAPSEKARLEIDRFYGRRDGVTVIHHAFPSVPPIDDRREARRRLGLPETAIVALFVGDPRKGLDTAAQAVAAVDGVCLAVVSRARPTNPLLAEAGARLGPRLRWLGSVADLAPVYRAADLLLHPTIYDTFGFVVVEAMAHGVPPVVTVNAGSAELVRHQASGWIVRGESGEGTTVALRALAGDAALRIRLARGAQEAAKRRRWADVTHETLAVYERAARK